MIPALPRFPPRDSERPVFEPWPLSFPSGFPREKGLIPHNHAFSAPFADPAEL